MLILAMPGIVLATGLLFAVQQHRRPAGKRRRHRDFYQRPDGHPLRAEGAGKPDARRQQPLRFAVPVAGHAGFAGRLRVGSNCAR